MGKTKKTGRSLNILYYFRFKDILMKKMRFTFFFLFLLYYSNAQVLSSREQAKIIDEILSERLSSLLPQLMKRNNIEMWVIISREYNEDPVLKTMLPATWLSARRRTILVFYNNPYKKIYEKLAIARYNVGENIKASWDMQKFPNQWDALMDIIKSRNPSTIAINNSKDFGHADGLDHTEYVEFMNKLPAVFKTKVISAETLAVNWLESRTDREMQIYPQLISITHKIIEEGFSEKTITPGITTSDDLVWWFRQKIKDVGLDTWFHPSVAIQRSDSSSFEHLRSFSERPKDDIIQPGDLVHVDIGITYLRLNTDCQQHVYILKPDETEAPLSLRKAFDKANRLQDILTAQFQNGKTGNQILAGALAQAKREGIEATIYTHPLGFHGHAAGPTIGLWDQQGGVQGSGDFPLNYKTVYSIELNAATEVKEWKKSIRIMLEEDGYFDENGFRYIGGRQKELYVIPRKNTVVGQ
jgi:Xaa-Pro aminopeptidase